MISSHLNKHKTSNAGLKPVSCLEALFPTIIADPSRIQPSTIYWKYLAKYSFYFFSLNKTVSLVKIMENYMTRTRSTQNKQTWSKKKKKSDTAVKLPSSGFGKNWNAYKILVLGSPSCLARGGPTNSDVIIRLFN